jgi:hypothetical protein
MRTPPFLLKRAQRHQTPVRLLVAALFSACLIAQAQQLPTDQIVKKCLSTTNRDYRLRDSYTYRVDDETKDLNRAGRVNGTHSEVVEILYFAGKPYEHLIEKNGKKLSGRELDREERKMSEAASEASKLSDQQRAERLRKVDREREKRNEFLQYIPAVYSFRLDSEVTLNGRKTYAISARPKPDYDGKYAGLLRKMQGKLFIDERDYSLVRLEADVLDRISFGLFLARVSRGTRLTFEQVLVNNEIWLPKMITVHADARALVKAYRFDETLLFSDYRKFESDSRIVSTTAPGDRK